MQLGQRLRVYKNLARTTDSSVIYSVMDVKTRRVIAHVRDIILSKVTFKVSEAGKRRAQRTGVRNVHAYIEGSFDMYIPMHVQELDKITYNPFDDLGFRKVTSKEEVASCNYVYIGQNGVFADRRHNAN